MKRRFPEDWHGHFPGRKCLFEKKLELNQMNSLAGIRPKTFPHQASFLYQFEALRPQFVCLRTKDSKVTDPYPNAIAGVKAASKFQFALDVRTNALVSPANNAGALTTVGTVMIDGETADLVSAGCFDIVSPSEGTDAAFAVSQGI